MELPDKETPMENLPNEVSADTRLPCLLASSSTVAPPSCVATSASNNNEAQNSLSGAAVVIRMRGLPCDCTAAQIIEFFKAGGEGNAVDVFDGEGGIFIVQAADGRATTDAFVFLSSEEDAVKALSKQDSIGLRYIEHLRSTTAEIKQAVPHIRRASNAVQLLLQNWPAKKASISTNEQLAGKPAAAKPANPLSKAATTNVIQKKPAGGKDKESDSSSSSNGDTQNASTVAKANAQAVKSNASISPTKQAALRKTKKDSSSDDSDSSDDEADPVSTSPLPDAPVFSQTAASTAATLPVGSAESATSPHDPAQGVTITAANASLAGDAVQTSAILKRKRPDDSTAMSSVGAKVGVTAAGNKCTVYHCDLCDFYALEPNAVKFHLGSTAHLKAVGLRATATQVEGLSTAHSVEAITRNKVYHCPLCNKVTTDKMTFDGHLAGNPHRTAVASGATAQASLLILPMTSLAMTPAATATINKATSKVPLKSAAKESRSSVSLDLAALPQTTVSESSNHTPSNQNAPKQRRNDDCESGEFESSSDDDNAKLSSASAARLNASASGPKAGRGKTVSRRLRHRKYRHRQRQAARFPLGLAPDNLQASSGLDSASVSSAAGESSAFLSPAVVLPSVSPMPDAPRHAADGGRGPNARLSANANDNGDMNFQGYR